MNVLANQKEEPGGPLAGIRVVEIAAVGPVTFCALQLANLGAEVVRINRPPGVGGAAAPALDVLAIRRPSLEIDLRDPEGREALLGLCAAADVLVEGMRPGVMERLGLGPDACLERNPRLVYGRASGYGRVGPLASAAGHDINYLALCGALWSMGADGARPTPPLNMAGDYGGGAMTLLAGLLAALVERGRSGRGQVVETSLLEGTTQLMALPYHARAKRGLWALEEERHDPRAPEAMLSGRAPWYRTYETSDGGLVAVGAVEAPFYELLLETLGIDPASLPPRSEPSSWPAIESALAAAFGALTRDEAAARFEGVDACVTPVLSPMEAPLHPHNRETGLFDREDGGFVPAAAPRLSRTPARRPPSLDESGDPAVVLAGWSLTSEQLAAIAPGPAVGLRTLETT